CTSSCGRCETSCCDRYPHQHPHAMMNQWLTRYGLRYGFAFRTTLSNDLHAAHSVQVVVKSYRSCSFTAVTRVQIPSGTPTNLNNVNPWSSTERMYMLSSRNWQLGCFKSRRG